MDLRTFLEVVGVVIVVALVAAAIVLAVAIRKLRRIRVPPDADFFTTVRAVPLSLVVGLDLLDLGLDFLSTPIVWFILDRTNLKALRNTATVEALLPFTGPIPTLTLAWIAARTLGLGRPYDPNVIETERVGDSYIPRTGRAGRAGRR
ncbi:MAG TPA: hypothetical protein VEL74_06545 [Thermoanaerobaculia bacterium]|nr:hypothetical protein [Thermoanaerobaculia bacterium]